MRLSLIVVITALLHFNVTGQHFYSRNYTVNDGLPSNLIRCIFKDSKGQMWIGTGAGLCLFDGTGFKVMSTANGLAGESIFSITEDDQQNLWIGSMKGGISKFDGRTFTKYTTKEGLVSDNVRVVWYSKKFRLLFIGTNDGCSVYDGKSFTSISKNETKTPDLYVMGFLEGEDYVICYTYNQSNYFRYFPLTKKFLPVFEDGYSEHCPSSSPLIQANGDTIIGNHRSGINIRRNGIKRSYNELGQVFDLKSDNEGNVWIAGWSENEVKKEMPGGLFKYDGTNVTRYSEKVGIADPSVWCLYYDTSYKILWVGTLNDGMYKIVLPAFEWYAAEDLDLNELKVSSLLVSKDSNIWIGTKGNLLSVQKKQELKIIETHNLKEILKYAPFDIKCIAEDSEGNIYCTPYNQAPLIRFSKSGNFLYPEIIPIQPAATNFVFNTSNTVYYTDKWWPGIYNCSISPKLSKPVFQRLNNNDEPKNIIKIISSGDTIWFCSNSEGIYRVINGGTDQSTKLNPSLPKNIKDICLDNNGNLIIGSNSGEVIFADRKTLSIKFVLKTGKELIGNTIRFLVIDNADRLYIGTNSGLNRVHLIDLFSGVKTKINFYSEETGYYDHSGKVAVCDHDGNIWIGTDNHLLKVNAKILNCFEPDPILRINSVEINYQPDSAIDFNILNKFSHNENNLIFHFSCLNYLNPDQTLFRYKLDGHTEKWSDYSPETSVSFTSLNPGKYRLIIESYNQLDNTKTDTVFFIFRITPPWYLNPWFIAFIILLIISGIYLFIKNRTLKIRKEEERKSDFSRQLATIEMRALQSQMNPHFIFNSMNSIQGLILKNKTDEALGYLMDFSKILRQTLENATKEFITLEEEIQYIQYYLKLELLRFDNKFKVEIEVPDKFNLQAIEIPPMIIQPYVENAIRHGLLHKESGIGLLLISFLIEGDNFLKCTVEDNGVGRVRSNEIENWKNQTSHKALSTRITHERIELLNSTSASEKYHVKIIDLYNTEGIGSGTKIEIFLPLILA